MAMNKFFFTGFILIQIILFGCATTNADDLIRKQRILESSQWSGEYFQNPEQIPATEWWPSVKTFWNYFFNQPDEVIPEDLLPAQAFDVMQWDGQRNLQFTWLGHTTFLIKMGNRIILTDPMFSQRLGSYGWLSPERYAQMPASIDMLPAVDVVLITHNHLDHLDEHSIKMLITKTSHFIAPLVVGEMLEEWGVPKNKITELDWWQEKSIEDLTITAAPAKHTSERGIFDKNETLWVSYAIQGQKHNLYLGGDSGWHKQLYEIGERLGPFDVTFFEIGAYGEQEGWKQVHYTPEQAVKAHQAVKGKLMVPAGWGTFNLALFPWYEPIERFLVAADQAGIDYLTPEIGEVIRVVQSSERESWWRAFIHK